MAHSAVDLPDSIGVAEHRRRILDAIDPLPPLAVAVAQALGLTLAEDVVALVDVPGFDNSAMDGYAMRRSDVVAASQTHPVLLRVVADLPAGSAGNPRIGPGETARIMTGAPIPDDADCVVPVEHTDGGGPIVSIGRRPAPSAHIRPAGSDVRRGDPVLGAGRVLRSRDLAAAAAAGVGRLFVHPSPRVAVLSTGSELRSPGEPLARGQIHDSNSLLLAAAVAEAGCTPVRIGAVPDDEEGLREVLTRCVREVDAVITSGGVSVGAYDVVKAVLAPLGFWFGPVRMQPGKPQGFGRWLDGTPVFALPGNPVSATVSFEAFVRPALRRLQGRSDLDRPSVSAVAADSWRSPQGRTQYMPVSVEHDEHGGLVVRRASEGGSGSYLVASLARADGFAIVQEDALEVRAGDEVHVVLFDGPGSNSHGHRSSDGVRGGATVRP